MIIFFFKISTENDLDKINLKKEKEYLHVSQYLNCLT